MIPVREELVALVKERGWSWSEWSRASGVAPGVISRWLRDQRTITVPTLERLAGAMGMRVGVRPITGTQVTLDRETGETPGTSTP